MVLAQFSEVLHFAAMREHLDVHFSMSCDMDLQYLQRCEEFVMIFVFSGSICNPC